MNQEDRDRLMRIETLLTESVVPRINDHGKKIQDHGEKIHVLEKVAWTASIIWGGACVVGWVAKDAAAAWLKKTVVGHG